MNTEGIGFFAWGVVAGYGASFIEDLARYLILLRRQTRNRNLKVHVDD